MAEDLNLYTNMRTLFILKPFYYCLSIILVLLLSGCDKVCNKSTQDVAQIQNMTGRTLKLSVCKGRNLGEVETELPPDTYKNEINLGVRADSEIRGGPGGCSGVQDGKAIVGLTLAPTSYSTVKLCYNDVTKENLIIELQQSCPVNFLEQTSTGPCTN